MQDLTQISRILFMPDGKPVPEILTAAETIELLRLDSKNPERTLKYWRDEGQLQGVRLGRKVRYRLEDIMKFLDKKVE